MNNIKIKDSIPDKDITIVRIMFVMVVLMFARNLDMLLQLLVPETHTQLRRPT